MSSTVSRKAGSVLAPLFAKEGLGEVPDSPFDPPVSPLGKGGRRQRMAQRTLATVALLLLVACGCRGSGTINIVPAATGKISTTAPLIEEFRPTECYYWVTPDNELRISMRQVRRSISKLKREEFILSLVLRGLPAGAGRDYRASRQTMRAQRWKGFGHARLASFGGIVAVWDYGKRALRGRFRLPAKRQAYSFLTGWGGDQPLLMVGDFTAIPNQAKGEAILARTEKRGMERGAERRRARRIQGPPRKSK